MSHPVPYSSELARVIALPRRVWSERAADDLAKRWTPQLLNPTGLAIWDRLNRLSYQGLLDHLVTEFRMREHEISSLENYDQARAEVLEAYGRRRTPIELVGDQAMMLWEFVNVGGLTAIAPVGTGKTLFFWLAALLAQRLWGYTRIVQLIFGSGYDQTISDFGNLAKYWQAPRPDITVTSYQAIGKPRGQWKLCDCALCRNLPGAVPSGESLYPQLLMLDESDNTRNPVRCTERIDRWRTIHRKETRMITATGSGVRHSYSDLAHHLRWTIGERNAPVPCTYQDNEDWRGALDNKPRKGYNTHPGALLALTDHREAGLDETRAARRGFARRLAETPGIIIISKSSCDTPIHIRVLQAPDDPELEAEFYACKFEGASSGPPGTERRKLKNPFEKLAHDQRLGCGFVSYYDPKPPQWWLEAKAAWGELVSELCAEAESYGEPIDSEGVAALRCRNHPTYQAWVEARNAFGKPRSVARPISLSLVNYAAEWLRINTPALVWTPHTWFGQALSHVTGVPYFQGKGKSSNGLRIQSYDPQYSAILSTKANSRQRNLQGWNRMLFVSPEHSNADKEQRLGRAHRRGQTKPLYVDEIVSCSSHVKALQAMQDEALASEDVSLVIQKVNTATFDWSHVADYVLDPTLLPESEKAKRARWSGL